MRGLWGADVANTVAKWLGLTAAEESVDDAEMERLARLDLLTYEREREAAARQLEIRVTTLDKLVEEKRQHKQQDTVSGFLVVNELPSLRPLARRLLAGPSVC
jgi:hypothetical protein